MGFGLWALGFGLWALGFGLWALGFGGCSGFFFVKGVEGFRMLEV